MAKRTPVTETVHEETKINGEPLIEDDGTQFLSDTDPDDEDVQLNELFKSTDLNKGSALIKRKQKGEENFSFVGRVNLEGMNGPDFLEHLRVTYGTGSYLIKFLRANGRFFQTGRMDIIVDKPVQTPQIEIQGQNGNSSEYIKVLTEMQSKGEDRSEKFFMLMMQMQAQAQQSQMGLLTALLPALAGKGGEGSSLVDLMKCVQLMQPTRTPMLELVESMKAVKSLTNGETTVESETKPKEEGMFETILKAAAPLIAGAMANRMNQNQPQQTQVRASSPVIDNQPRTLNFPPMFGMIIGKMINAAKSETPHEVYLDLTFEFLGEDDLSKLELIFNQPNWPEIIFGNPNLAKLRPEFDSVRSWFEAYRTGFLEERKPEETPQTANTVDTQNPPTTGNGNAENQTTVQ